VRLIIIEDDYLQAETAIRSLKEAIPELEVLHIDTEKGFLDTFEYIAKDPPDAIILDIMLRWTNPARDYEPPPKEVTDDKFYRAGFRCARRLQVDPRTSGVPILLRSVVDPRDLQDEFRSLPDNIFTMSKLVDLSSVVEHLLSIKASKHTD
jgi:hypothetical protein